MDYDDGNSINISEKGKDTTECHQARVRRRGLGGEGHCDPLIEHAVLHDRKRCIHTAATLTCEVLRRIRALI
jgi:hypothetical protein